MKAKICKPWKWYNVGQVVEGSKGVLFRLIDSGVAEVYKEESLETTVQIPHLPEPTEKQGPELVVEVVGEFTPYDLPAENQTTPESIPAPKKKRGRPRKRT